MEQLLYLVAPLGCALMMAVCFGMMAKGMRGNRGDNAGAPEGTDEIAELRAEVARLRADQREPVDG